MLLSPRRVCVNPGAEHQDPQLGIRKEHEKVFRTQVRGQVAGRQKPRRAIAQRGDEFECGRLATNAYSGSTHTTAVQLWKPPNCPSARAICP